MVEGRRGSISDQRLSNSGPIRDGDGHESGDVGEGCRKWGVRDGEGCPSKGFQVVDGLDDAGIKGDDGFGLPLMKVSEVDGGRPGSASRAECSEESRAKGVPVVAVDAASFKGIKPFESVTPKGIEYEGHCLLSIPVGSFTGTGDSFDPLFGGELVFDITCVERKFGQIGLAEVVDVGVDHGDGEKRR